MRGTTFSGDTLGTTLFGTMRNWFYHLFAIYKNLNLFSFHNLINELPIKAYTYNGLTINYPRFHPMLKILSYYLTDSFAGDDTGIMFLLS